MIETWAVIVLIAGIVMGFSGAFLSLAASSMRKPLEKLASKVDEHSTRIGHLERRDASREEQIKNIMDGIVDLKQMLQRHEDKG